MPIAFSRKRVRYLEVWFDEPIPRGIDVAICRQRPTTEHAMVFSEFHTLLIDLYEPLERILDGLDKDTRYEIRRAGKDDLEVNFLVPPTHEQLVEFSQFFNAFAEHKGLTPVSHHRLNQVLEAGHLVLTQVRKNDLVLVWHAYYVAAGTARLLHSASHYRELDSSTKAQIGRANRLLHWKDIEKFKSLGYLKYDLGGWSPPAEVDAEKARINSFKESFGGRHEIGYNFALPLTRKGSVVLAFQALKRKIFFKK